MEEKKTFDQAVLEMIDLLKEKNYKKTREKLLENNEADSGSAGRNT